MTPSRGAGRRGGPLAARAGMAPAGDTMNLTEPAKCQARTDDSGAPSPPTAWGRCAAVKGSLRRPGRLKILGEPPARLFPIVTTTPDSDRGVPSALDRRSAPARRHPRQPRSSPDWTRLTNVAIAPNIPRIAAGHPNNRRFTDRTISPSLSHWTAGPTAVRDRIAQYRRDLGITHLIVTRLRIGGVDATHLERSVETVASMFS